MPKIQFDRLKSRNQTLGVLDTRNLLFSTLLFIDLSFEYSKMPLPLSLRCHRVHERKPNMGFDGGHRVLRSLPGPFNFRQKVFFDGKLAFDLENLEILQLIDPDFGPLGQKAVPAVEESHRIRVGDSVPEFVDTDRPQFAGA